MNTVSTHLKRHLLLITAFLIGFLQHTNLAAQFKFEAPHPGMKPVWMPDDDAPPVAPRTFMFFEVKDDPEIRFIYRSAFYRIRFSENDLRFTPKDAAPDDAEPVTFRLEGTNGRATLEGIEPSPEVYNFYVGEPSEWQIGVHSFSGIRHRDVYPGVDAVYQGKNGRLMMELHGEADTDPTALSLIYEEGLQKKARRVPVASLLEASYVAGSAWSVQTPVDVLLYDEAAVLAPAQAEKTTVGGVFDAYLPISGTGGETATGQTFGCGEQSVVIVGFGDPSEVSDAGGRFAWVARVDPSADSPVPWISITDSEGDDYYFDAATDGTNNQAVTVGSSSSSEVLDLTNNGPPGTFDGLVAECDCSTGEMTGAFLDGNEDDETINFVIVANIFGEDLRILGGADGTPEDTDPTLSVLYPEGLTRQLINDTDNVATATHGVLTPDGNLVVGGIASEEWILVDGTPVFDERLLPFTRKLRYDDQNPDGPFVTDETVNDFVIGGEGDQVLTDLKQTPDGKLVMSILTDVPETTLDLTPDNVEGSPTATGQNGILIKLNDPLEFDKAIYITELTNQTGFDEVFTTALDVNAAGIITTANLLLGAGLAVSEVAHLDPLFQLIETVPLPGLGTQFLDLGTGLFFRSGVGSAGPAVPTTDGSEFAGGPSDAALMQSPTGFTYTQTINATNETSSSYLTEIFYNEQIEQFIADLSANSAGPAQPNVDRTVVDPNGEAIEFLPSPDEGIGFTFNIVTSDNPFQVHVPVNLEDCFEQLRQAIFINATDTDVDIALIDEEGNETELGTAPSENFFDVLLSNAFITSGSEFIDPEAYLEFRLNRISSAEPQPLSDVWTVVPANNTVVVIGNSDGTGKTTLQDFELLAFDLLGNRLETQIVTANEAGPELPSDFVLHANYPNPFNPTTRIQFDLPNQNTINLGVYDVTGRRVQTLASGLKAAGRHMVTWNGRDEAGRAVAGGVYLVRLEAGDFVQTRKMVMVK